ncbi:MAG: DsbA family protein [Proteobacteria bacterium]|nr:DsbA family protein [Pseudomonadota bacterium]
MTTVDFYPGLASRYSYLAASQIDRIEAQTGCRFVWKPIASGQLIDRRDNSPFRKATGSGQYDWGYSEYDAKGWAAYYGIPFREPAALQVDPSLPALACLAAEKQGALVACCRCLQHLIFAEGATVDAAMVASLPARLGLQEGAFHRDLDAPWTRARHEALIDEAAGRRLWRADLLCRSADVLGQRPPAAFRSGVGRHGAAALAGSIGRSAVALRPRGRRL